MVSGYLNTFEHSIGSLSHCIDNYVPGILNWAEMHDVAGLIAPRPLFVESGETRQHLSDRRQHRELQSRARDLGVFGAADRVEQEVFPDEHAFWGRRGIPFLARHLNAWRSRTRRAGCGRPSGAARVRPRPGRHRENVELGDEFLDGAWFLAHRVREHKAGQVGKQIFSIELPDTLAHRRGRDELLPGRSGQLDRVLGAGLKHLRRFNREPSRADVMQDNEDVHVHDAPVEVAEDADS